MITVHRAAERYRSAPEPGVETRHAFSFSGHYDPRNTSFGALLACNEERLAPGAGFADHRHRDTEIVTWVLSGALAHRDDQGHAAVVRPGHVQRLSAGGGVTHSERAAGGSGGGGGAGDAGEEGAGEGVRFLQFWLQPDEPGGEPGYGLHRVDPTERHSVLAGPETGLRRADAALHLLRADAYGTLPPLPAAAYRYLHVARGAVGLRTRSGPRGQGVELGEGDALRLRDTQPDDLTAGPEGAELLVWAMGSALRLG